MKFAPLTRMWQRIEVTRTESDTALFYDLLFFGELLIKLSASGMTACLSVDRERQRYGIEYGLVRANSVGDWVSAMDELLAGPASQLMSSAASEHKRELTQRWSRDDDVWQRRSLDQLLSVCRLVDPQFEAPPQKASLQRWFQMFAWLRNRTRGHGAPTGVACSGAAPALEESLVEFANGFGLFKQPWALLHRNLTGKYRVVPLAGDQSAFEHLKRVDDRAHADGVHIALDSELALVPLVHTDVDLSNFYLPNGNFRAAGYEAISYITDDLRTIDAADYMLPPTALPRSGTTATPSLDVVGQSFSNVPPRLPDYVRREKLETELSTLLRDDRHPIVTLVGRGGVGKTSLALEILHAIANLGDFFAVIWFSARDIDLLPQGPKRVQPDVLTQDDIARQFVDLMNPAGSAVKSFDDLGYLEACLSGRATDGPFLFVFDNFETVRNPLDVYNALDAQVRLPNKILITSRFRDFRGDYPLEVRGMNRDEFDDLVTTTTNRLGIGPLISSKFRDELFDESDGHPYVVKVLLGEVATHKRAASIERVMASREDILDALFERTFAALSPACQRVFLTLCNWRSIAPRLAIEAALLRPANERIDVTRALDTLEQSSLIELIGEQDPAQQFVRVPLAAALFGRRKLIVHSGRISIEADTEVMRMFGATSVHQASGGIGPRVDRVVKSLAARISAGQDIDEDLAVLEFVCRSYPAGWLRVADLWEEQPDGAIGLPRAVDAIKSYLQIQPDDVGVWRRLADLCARRDDALGELQARFTIAEQPDASYGDVTLVALRFNSLIASRHLVLPVDEKRALAERIRRMLERRLDEADASGFSRLAWICLHLDDDHAARVYTQKGLDLEPYHHHCVGLAKRLRMKY